MSDSPAYTESLCPHCFRRIKARRVTEKNSVFLYKTCPDHGDLGKVLVWRNRPFAYEEWSGSNNRSDGEPFVLSPGCPSNCGLCPDHKQNTCTAIIEVTHRCNMHCPICFAASSDSEECNPSRRQIEEMLQTVLDRSGSCPVQLSGGEPTLREDLPDIVSLACSLGFDPIQVNTNGIRLAEDAGFTDTLRDAGLTVVFLQFDGLTDDVHLRIRGTALSATKLKAIERCAESKLGVILVPTIVRGVNDHQIGAIIQFAKEHMPIVKGVHFQPMTFLGRYPEAPGNSERILIPDILAAIEEQTGGELKPEHFVPPGCEAPHCSFSAFAFLDETGCLVPTTRFTLSRDLGVCCGGDPSTQSQDSVRNRWKYRKSELPVIADTSINTSVSGGGAHSGSFLDRVRSHSLSISGMAFQDAWNLDLERLERCCVHVVTPENKMIPFCAYYLTGAKGQRLYRH